MTYPGFDPAPGNHSALASLSRACTGLAVELADHARRARALRDLGVCTGRAAEAFGDCGGTLPQELDRAGQAFDEAALAVATFGSTVEGQQQQARVLARRIEDPTLDPQARADLVRRAHRLCHAVTEEAARANRAPEHAPRRTPTTELVRPGARRVQPRGPTGQRPGRRLRPPERRRSSSPVGCLLPGELGAGDLRRGRLGHDRVRRHGPCDGRRADGCRGGGRSGRHPPAGTWVSTRTWAYAKRSARCGTPCARSPPVPSRAPGVPP